MSGGGEWSDASDCMDDSMFRIGKSSGVRAGGRAHARARAKAHPCVYAHGRPQRKPSAKEAAGNRRRAPPGVSAKKPRQRLARSAPAEAFLRTVVEPCVDARKPLRAEARERTALRVKPPDQAVGVLVAPALPGVVGAREVDVKGAARGGLFVQRELFAVGTAADTPSRMSGSCAAARAGRASAGRSRPTPRAPPCLPPRRRA